jgi:ribokinase
LFNAISTMPNILVVGHINLETTLRVDGFPVEYAPVRYPFFGVNSSVSGVGFNIAKALTTLGDSVKLLSVIGDDASALLVRTALRDAQIDDVGVLPLARNTAQSVILYDSTGKRQIHTDLKDVQDTTYPPEAARAALNRATLAVLCNINYSRPLLQSAQKAGIPIATDVHAISDLDDAYNRDYMAVADILFMSHEHLPASPEDWARAVQKRYGNAIIVIGMGSEGALLAVRGTGLLQRFPAVTTRPVVNTIGAGDALFSAFLHTWQKTKDPVTALQTAQVFASWKIGATGAADGFLNAAELEHLTQTTRTA